MTNVNESERSYEAQAEDVFSEILKTGILPAECTALAIDETALGGHNPVLRRVLEMMGSSSKATYTTEYNGTHLPSATRERVTPTYQKFIKWCSQQGYTAQYLRDGLCKKYPLGPNLSPDSSNYSMRLHSLVIAHGTKWNEVSQKVMHVMANIYAPALKYKFTGNSPNQGGDYNPLVAWAYANNEHLDNLYIEKGDIPHLAAKIAKGTRVVPNMAAIKNLLGFWESQSGDLNIDTLRIGKPKSVDAVKAPRFPRPGETNITRGFQRLFVDLDPRNMDEIRQALGEPDLTNEEAAMYASNIDRLHTLILSLMSEGSGQGKASIMGQLDQATGMNGQLPHLLRSTMELAMSQSTVTTLQLKSYDTKLKTSLDNALDQMTKQMNRSPYPGFGAARSLLVRHTELSVKNDPAAQDIEKLMYRLVEIAEGRADNFLLTSEDE